jgi:hypothetical protein
MSGKNGKSEQQVPPLRYGMTNKRTGNGKGKKQILRFAPG